MNAQERLRVARLVTRLAQAPDQPKDEDAALELAALLKVRPDAPYLLMQRALGLELALEQAQAELEQLRQQLQGQIPGQVPAQASSPGRYQTLPSAAAHAPVRSAGAPAGGGWQPGMPGGPAPGYGGGAGLPSAGGSFLRNAAAVGAGVLGGSLLFHGLDSLFHDHGHGGAGGGNSLLSGDMQAPLESLGGNEFIDPAGGGGGGLLDGDMLGDGGELDTGDEDWA